jgi:hypothetical protein
MSETSEADRDAAYDFLKKAGLEPTPDAIANLSGPLLNALRIVCERGYSERMWRMRGWKGLVHDIIDKAFRLRFRAWEQNSFDGDSPTDMINFCCYYLRLKNGGKPWGEMGNPG